MKITNQQFVTAIRKAYPKLIVPAKAPRSYFNKAYKLINSSNITVEDAELIGRWLAKQGWLKSPTTLIVVASKAGEWLAKAQAEQNKPVAPRTRKEDDWITTEDFENEEPIVP